MCVCKGIGRKGIYERERGGKVERAILDLKINIFVEE